MQENRLKRLWKEKKIALNAWLTIPSAWTAEVMAQVGFDSLTIDLQHGLIDYHTALAMLQAISTTTVVPLVRAPWNEPSMIMRLLDAGAYGVICPMVNSRAEAEAFVQACRYPPAGNRSYGPTRAAVYSGGDYFSSANQTVLALAMIETTQALEDVEDIAATRGLPVGWPDLDEEAMQLVDMSLVWGGFTDYLVERGAPADGVAIIAARREGPARGRDRESGSRPPAGGCGTARVSGVLAIRRRPLPRTGSRAQAVRGRQTG